MSWQRILRFAKQRQVPVIITDESGEEPLILLSLDQLEQALDGGAGPDLPPVPPAPRPTTPSFVPEDAASPAEPVPAEPPPVPAPSAESPVSPLPAALSTFAELEEAAQRAAPPAVDIVIPPTTEGPAPTSSEPPAPVAPSSKPAMPPLLAAPSPSSSPRPDLSLEERFFLDF